MMAVINRQCESATSEYSEQTLPASLRRALAEHVFIPVVRREATCEPAAGRGIEALLWKD